MGHVRIYGTIGPACKDSETMRRMFLEGMDGIRLNLSHASLEEAAALIETSTRQQANAGSAPNC